MIYDDITIVGIKALSKEVDMLKAAMCSEISSYMQNTRKISFCTDLWTKKGMTSSYIGISAHFFSLQDYASHCTMLAVRRIEHPHTGLAIRQIFDTILGEWAIPTNKVRAVVTDNGSNIVKAFKEHVAQIIHDSEAEGEADEEGVMEQEADEGVETGLEKEGQGTVHVVGSEVGSSEEEDFDRRESSIVAQFSSMTRLSCFAHTLQLVVVKFNNDASVKPVLKNAYALVKKVNSSTRATQLLVQRCGKKLVSNCPTRWSSTFLLIDRMLEVREALNQVLFELNMDNMNVSEWNVLQCIKTLLQPFAAATSLMSGDTYVTLSDVIPTYFILRDQLESVVQESSFACVKTVADLMLKELVRRFHCLVSPDDSKHDPIYAIATLLHPSLKNYVVKNASLLKSTKEEIITSIKEECGEESEGSAAEEDACPPVEQSDVPKPKRPCLDLTGFLIPSARQKNLERYREESGPRRRGSISGKLDFLLNLYIEEKVTMAHYDHDPVRFWLLKESLYSHIARYAVDTLQIPASSATVERLFSTEGESCSGKQSNLQDARLEREVLLHRNKKYCMAIEKLV